MADHKTARTTGAVEVRLERRASALFLLLRSFAKSSSGPFFTQNGHPMTTSLSIELSKLCTSLGVAAMPPPTDLRKAAHTLAEVETQRDREALAGMLHHSTATAATHYRLVLVVISSFIKWLFVTELVLVQIKKTRQCLFNG